MKQLIARISPELHGRLKARAAAEGRSLNSLVEQALEAAAGGEVSPGEIRARIDRLGLRVVPPKPKGSILTDDEVRESLRGSGSPVLDALLEERRSR
ncbi:MAG TPA: toxin-antitoxin system HicB family antitoxin [Actinomycetota bacterium]